MAALYSWISVWIWGCLVAWLVYHCWCRQAGGRPDENLKPFLAWMGKGALVPMVLWVFINAGWLPGYEPLMEELRQAKKSVTGLPADQLFEATEPAGLVIVCYWGSVSLAWLLVLQAREEAFRRQILVTGGVLFLLLSPLVLFLPYRYGWPLAGLACLIWLGPLAYFALPIPGEQAEMKPIYTAAVVKMKFGKYRDAEEDVIKQLEQCEDDFDGWMMLAELYACHFQELDEADRTIRELCAQPKAQSIQVCMALQRLADWHLKLGNDPVSARAALQEIITRFPGTPAARSAQQRLDHLPETKEELLEQREPKKFRIPALAEQTKEEAEASRMPREKAVELANRYVAKLTKNPNDVGVREELALVFGEQLGKTELACQQLELLLGMAGQPPTKKAEWLGMMAAWQLKYDQNADEASRLLEQILREYPDTPQALAAKRRLDLIETERRLRERRPLADRPKVLRI